MEEKVLPAKDKLRLGILGIGALGAEQLARFRNAGIEVYGIGRKESPHFSDIKRKGITIEPYAALPGGERIYVSPDTLEKFLVDDITKVAGKLDAILIVTKGYHLDENFINTVIKPALAINPQLCFVFEQNGLPFWWNTDNKVNKKVRGKNFSDDPTGALLEALGGKEEAKKHILHATISTATVKSEPGVVMKMNAPADGQKTFYADIAEIDDFPRSRADILQQMFTNAGMPARVPDIHPGIRPIIVFKLILNIVGCFTAATGKSLGKTLSDDTVKEAISLAIDEALTIAKEAWNITLTYKDEKNYERACDAEFFIELIKHRFAHHKPSILQDINSGSPTEIKTIVGRVLDTAEWIGYRAPMLQSLYDIVTHISKIALNTNSKDSHLLKQEWKQAPARFRAAISNAEQPTSELPDIGTRDNDDYKTPPGAVKRTDSDSSISDAGSSPPGSDDEKNFFTSKTHELTKAESFKQTSTSTPSCGPQSPVEAKTVKQLCGEMRSIGKDSKGNLQFYFDFYVGSAIRQKQVGNMLYLVELINQRILETLGSKEEQFIAVQSNDEKKKASQGQPIATVHPNSLYLKIPGKNKDSIKAIEEWVEEVIKPASKGRLQIIDNEIAKRLHQKVNYLDSPERSLQ